MENIRRQRKAQKPKAQGSQEEHKKAKKVWGKRCEPLFEAASYDDLHCLSSGRYYRV